jgi:hypothetical protein
MALDSGNRAAVDLSSAPFIQSNAPDHLQISGETIYVVSDAFTQVRLYSLADGRPLRADNRATIYRTASERVMPPVMMRVIGDALYLGSREVRGYNPRNNWGPLLLDSRTAIRLRDLQVAQGHVVAISEFAGVRGAVQPNQPSITLLLSAFSRALVQDGKESGLYQHRREITDRAGITKWQLVDGGVYYLAGDQRLHFLKGSGGAEK